MAKQPERSDTIEPLILIMQFSGIIVVLFPTTKPVHMTSELKNCMLNSPY